MNANLFLMLVALGVTFTAYGTEITPLSTPKASSVNAPAPASSVKRYQPLNLVVRDRLTTEQMISHQKGFEDFARAKNPKARVRIHFNKDGSTSFIIEQE